MITSICSYTADSQGMSAFPALESGLFAEVSRRVEKTPLINASVFLQDFGQVYGDSVFDITAQFKESIISKLQYLAKTHFLLTISTINGVFLGSIVKVNSSPTEIKISFSVKSKLSQ